MGLLCSTTSPNSPCSHGVEDPEACPHDLALGERVGELVAALLAGETGRPR